MVCSVRAGSESLSRLKGIETQEEFSRAALQPVRKAFPVWRELKLNARQAVP